MTREERIKGLEKLKLQETKLEEKTSGMNELSMPYEVEKLELPPLSVFLDAVTENATVKRVQSQVAQVQNEYRFQKRDWWNYFRLNANYAYGRFNTLN